MFFVLQCGGIPFNGDTIKTKSLGGSESAAYYLAKELAALGHRVTLFTNTQEPGVFDGVRYEPMGRPTEQTPLGENFHYYAANTPHDVCILQRHPKAFHFRWASKINLWWLHDLALYRSKGDVAAMLYNIDRVLVVSEYHRQQVSKVYGIEDRHITPILNGVGKEAKPRGRFDLADQLRESGKKVLTYSSRPERGLDHLLRPGGIMDRLGNDYHLLFCGYENTTPAMADFYRALWSRAESMENVTNLGAITKQELANLMGSADLHIYPTEFEEVSCITAMECMAANLPMVTSAHAALPETCDGAGVELIPLRDGHADEDGFVAFVESFFGMPEDGREAMRKAQKKAAKAFSWRNVAHRVMGVVQEQLSEQSSGSIAAGMLRHSDIQAAREVGFESGHGVLAAHIASEIGQYYDWTGSEEEVAAHYATREEPLRRADVTASPRFKRVEHTVDMHLSEPNMRVVDWGCNAGHFTIPLALSNPHQSFIGVDFDKKAVEFARAWAYEEGATNAEFYTPEQFRKAFEGDYRTDVLLLCEVVEHAPDLAAFFHGLPESSHYLLTTPYGPWESLSFDKMGDYREHVHHLDRADIHDLFGHMPGFRVLNIPHPTPSLDLALGSYITEFDAPEGLKLGSIDYERKFAEASYRQTVSACILVGNSEETLLRCLRSVWPCVDELVLRLDESCNEATKDVIGSFLHDAKGHQRVQIIEGASPTEIGFDEARNETVEAATGDWVLWIDTDEEARFKDGWEGLLKLNCVEGYAIPQQHFSLEPAGVIKTDYPCRLFRNNGIKFFGVVHEHPEKELNEGVGPVQMTRLIEIAHHGYKDEGVRRGRFHRNFSLLERDRAKHPERKLGAMLWLRDCAQRIQYAMEENGGRLTRELIEIAEDGVKTWAWLVENADLRMVADGMEFYSVCAEAAGPGVEACLAIGVSDIPGGVGDSVPTHKGVFYSREHVRLLADRLLAQGEDVDSRYM